MKFVPSFADIATPLRDLLKQDAVWLWTSECQLAFDRLKRMIAEPPVLAHFDVEASTIVSCDASGTAIAGCLSQVKGGVERPVAFASRALSEAERKYSVSEREALACIWACERWHFYLYGRGFVLRTDHSALKTLLTSRGSGHRPLRLHRWYDRLCQYNFTVEFVPGKLHAVPDCLSRFNEASVDERPVNEREYLADESSVGLNTVFGSTNKPVITHQQLAAATQADETLQQVQTWVVGGWPDRTRMLSEFTPYYAVRHELTVLKDNTLMRGERAVIPRVLQQHSLQLAHEGHIGIVRMKERCRENMWWPGISKDIERFVRNCEPCIISGKSIKTQPAPLQPIEWPNGPWRKIAVDIAGEFQAAPQHQRYMIVAVDLHSKWPEVMLCGTVTSSKVIEFMTSLFSRFGLVDEVITDNGRQLVAVEFEQFLSHLGIKHSVTALYAPQGNGAVERMNRVLKDGIKAGMADGSSFATAVKQTLAAYRSSVQTTTGTSPASLMYSFNMRMPLSKMKLDGYQKNQTDITKVKKRVHFKQDQMTQRHDTKYRAKNLVLAPGDAVRIKHPVRDNKLSPTFTAPFKVRRSNGRTVWLENGQRWNVRRCVLHANNDIHDDLAEYPVPIDNPVASKPSGEVRRSSRIRTKKTFGPDFVQ